MLLSWYWRHDDDDVIGRRTATLITSTVYDMFVTSAVITAVPRIVSDTYTASYDCMSVLQQLSTSYHSYTVWSSWINHNADDGRRQMCAYFRIQVTNFAELWRYDNLKAKISSLYK